MRIDESIHKEGFEKHFEKQERRAQAIGIARLCSLVPATLEELKAAYEVNPYFNRAIPLEKWDSMDSLVRSMRRHTTIKGETKYREDGSKYFMWAPVDSVCVLKHVAKYHILGVSKEEQYEWEEYERRYSGYGNLPVSRTEFLRERQERISSGEVRAG
jgi:hypothetical protein